MIRTQVYFPDDLHRDLMLLTKTSGENFSSLVRLGATEVIKKRMGVKKDWKKFVGAAGKSNIKTNAVKDIHNYYTNWGE